MNRFIPAISLIILILGIGLAGCAGPTRGGGAAPGTASAGTPALASAGPSAQASAATERKTFTAAELAKYDGRNGNPAYIAVDGVVYDVTNARQWRGGAHEGYQAGKDYTKEIQQSPHGKSALSDIPIVGKYTGGS